MTDILFITPTERLTLKNEVNGTLLLGTKLLQAGFEVQLLRFGQIDSYHQDYHTFIGDITKKILELSPRCVSFYALWPNFHVMLRIAQTVRQRRPDIITVMGGPQVSATPRETLEAMPFIDYVCTGEGENTTVPFFTAILRGGVALDTVPGLYYRENGRVVTHDLPIPLCDLDSLPHWDKRLLLDIPDPLTQYKNYLMPIDAGRGCPYSCTFCCTSNFWRRMYRLKSPERIVEDIRFFQDNFNINSFWFSHDAFTSNKKLVSAVCDHIIQSGLNIQWRCASRADCLTEELIVKMKAAGLTSIEIGIETGSQRMQQVINKRLNLQQALKMIDCLLKNKIQVTTFFMYGFPQETEQDLRDTLDMVFSLIDRGVYLVDLFILRFCPQTAICEEYKDRLVFDPKMTDLFQNVYGWQEELPQILAHPELYPLYYTVEDSLRRSYQHLHTLAELYAHFPYPMKRLRQLYGGDDLRLYRDFYENNRDIFRQDPDYPSQCVKERAWELVANTCRNLEDPCLPQLLGLFRFYDRIWHIKNAPEDIAVQEIYDFSYADYKLGLPIEQYSRCRSEILLTNTGGKLELKVLSITPM